MSDILNKVKDFGNEIKTHWNTPAEGKYVPYKEYKDVVIGVGAAFQREIKKTIARILTVIKERENSK